MLGKQGISAVKRLTNQIFKDYGYVGMFSDDYEQAAQVESSSNSIKNTNNAASAILKPIEDLAEQKR